MKYVFVLLCNARTLRMTLSRGKDAGGDTFVVKKKKNRKLNLGASKYVPESSAFSSRISRVLLFSLISESLEQHQTSTQSGSISYTKEYISELRAGTSSVPSPRRTPPPPNNGDLVFDESEMAGAVIVDQGAPIGDYAVTFFFQVRTLMSLKTLCPTFLQKHL
jgi:hypothetical protein